MLEGKIKLFQGTKETSKRGKEEKRRVGEQGNIYLYENVLIKHSNICKYTQ